MAGIDKVRLEQSYRHYQPKTPVKRVEEGKPQFPFDPDEKGVIYERTESLKKDPQETLSRIRIEVEKKTEEETATPEKSGVSREAGESTGFTAWIVSLGRRFLTFLQGVWDVVWNGPERDRPAGSEEAASSASGEAMPAGEAQSEERLQQIIADHDMEQLVLFVTEGGAKKPARSTDLLTIYNRYGRVNQIDPSDRKKILEGNFNDIKL